MFGYIAAAGLMVIFAAFVLDLLRVNKKINLKGWQLSVVLFAGGAMIVISSVMLELWIVTAIFGMMLGLQAYKIIQYVRLGT